MSNEKVDLTLLGLESFIISKPDLTVNELLEKVDIGSTVIRRLLKKSKRIKFKKDILPRKYYINVLKDNKLKQETIINQNYNEHLENIIKDNFIQLSERLINSLKDLKKQDIQIPTVVINNDTDKPKSSDKVDSVSNVDYEELSGNISINPKEFEEWCVDNFPKLDKYFRLGNTFDKISIMNPILFEEGVISYLKYKRLKDE